MKYEIKWVTGERDYNHKWVVGAFLYIKSQKNTSMPTARVVDEIDKAKATPFAVAKMVLKLQKALYKQINMKDPNDLVRFEEATRDEYIFSVCDTDFRARVSRAQHPTVFQAKRAAAGVVMSIYGGMRLAG